MEVVAMCAEYKEEKQNKLNKKFEEKSKDLPEYIRDYFEFMKSADTKINTLGTIKKFFEWLTINNIISNIKQDSISKVSDVNIVKYLNNLKAQGLKHTSINTKMNQISGLWNYLVSKKYADTNIITDKVRELFEIEDTHEVVVPTEEEIAALESSIYNIPNESVAIKYTAIMQLLIGSGIRLGELVGLDIDDLHFDAPEPYITVMGKGRQNVVREITISDTAVIAVNDYLAIRNLNDKIKDMKPLFISTLGNRLSASTIQSEIEKHSNGNVHVHLLRHYIASKMYENGTPIATISKQLGHSSIDTTAKAYVKIDKSTTRNALNMVH
jgi:integrase/recombinase XerD